MYVKKTILVIVEAMASVQRPFKPKQLFGPLLSQMKPRQDQSLQWKCLLLRSIFGTSPQTASKIVLFTPAAINVSLISLPSTKLSVEVSLACRDALILPVDCALSLTPFE